MPISLSQLKIPTPVYLQDVKQAISEHELYGYVRLASEHYGFELPDGVSYLQMGRDFEGQATKAIEAFEVDGADQAVTVDSDLVSRTCCMFVVLVAAHGRQSELGTLHD